MPNISRKAWRSVSVVSSRHVNFTALHACAYWHQYPRFEGRHSSVAMKLTGHKTEAVYRRYAIVSEADLTAGVQKLAALHGSDPAPHRAVLPLRRTRRAKVGPKFGSLIGEPAR